MEIVIVKVENLKKKYPGQFAAQRCYVWVDLRGARIGAEYDPEIGGAIPMAVYHGLVRRFSIPALGVRAATKLLRELAPDAAIMCDSWESHWDGCDRTARLSAAGEDAEQRIARRCEEVY